MDEPEMTCPYCGGRVPASATVCPDCQEDLSSLVRLEQQHAILYNEALAQAREGNLEQAAARALAALDCREAFAPAHILLAKVYAQQEDWPNAQTHAARALALWPDDERTQALARAVSDRAQAAERERREQAAEAERTRQVKAQRYLATYERDMARAFGLGAGLMAFAAVVISWIGGGKRERG